MFVTDAFSIDTEIFSTTPGDPLFSGPTSRSFDITALLNTMLGQTIEITFQQEAQLDFMNATMDNASLLIDPVPEPSTMLLLGSGLAGLGFFRRRRKREA